MTVGQPPRWGLIAVLAAVALLSWLAREVNHLRFEYPEGWPLQTTEKWFTAEPDGMYHMRRVERMFEEGTPAAATDPGLDFPSGAAIPWPPYYDQFLYRALAPLAPDDPAERRAFLERAAASLPHWFGTLTSLAVALVAWRMFGIHAALIGGGYHALCWGSIYFSLSGIADHHAWVSMLFALLWLLATLAFLDRGTSRTRPWLLGGASGVVAGVLLGSWVASLVYLLILQFALGYVMLRHRTRLPGWLAPYGLSLHAAAALAVLPAILQSPWKASSPWMIVNLSWFHLAQLVAGALVFLPLLFFGEESRWRARHPLLVSAVLGGGTLLLWIFDAGPAAGIREGFAWVGRADEFMAGIAESEPLLGEDRLGTGGVFGWLGWGVIALPLAWLWTAWRGFGLGREGWLPWAVAIPVLFAQAASQRRFADALSIPMAVTLGSTAVAAARHPGLRPILAKIPTRLAAPACLMVVAIAHSSTLASSWDRWTHREEDRTSITARQMLGHRSLYDWLRAQTVREAADPAETVDPVEAGDAAEAGDASSPARKARRDHSVMAAWDQGHAIEWVAGWPTVATNFGSYVGQDSFRDPARFFCASSWTTAEEILDRRRTRFVVLHSFLPFGWNDLNRAKGGDRVRWKDSVAGALSLSEGTLRPPEDLRLVFVSPVPEPQPAPQLRREGPVPSGWIWERVPGARVATHLLEGARLHVTVELEMETSGYRFAYRAAAAAGPDGHVELRVPYSTEARNGDARVMRASWTAGDKGGELRVPELAVLAGAEVLLP